MKNTPEKKKKMLYAAKRTTLPYIYQLPTILLLVLLMLLPIIMVVRYSLYDNVIMNQNPVFVGLKNYSTVLKDETFIISLGNTLYFTLMSVIFHLIIGMVFALLLNSKMTPAVMRSLFRVFYIIPWVFTATIIAIIWRLILNPNGIINFILQFLHFIDTGVEWFASTRTALHAVTFVNIWAGYPFYMVSLLAGLQGVPEDLYEAATIDGANEGRKFISITIPHLMPIIISISMLDFIWTMQVFALVWMTTGGGPIHATEVLGTYTYKAAFSRYQFSAASASAVIILIISMAVAFLYIQHQKTRD
ncbi:MAG: sugar ABC transporter permease [Treponema sp.]|jgi:multiple sugar transport system permease protein|nr:sugar ABC transporter permease [Treponema sp.]